MTQEREDFLLKKCLEQVESHIGWGPAAEWSTQDFESLSERILEKTGTHLSIATLKRLFGVVKYDSRPTATTLNAVAQYIGYDNWRVFTQSGLSAKNEQPIQKPLNQSGNRKVIIWSSPIVILLIGFIGFNFLSHRSAPLNLNPNDFSFTSEKMVSEGVPNSVVFEYEAASLRDGINLFVQQSWDKRLRAQVSKNEKIHTSIYYYPGYFIARLVAEDQVLQMHDLYIKTNGWQPLIEQEKVPVYLSEHEVIREGAMELTVDQIQNRNIDMQPATPWIAFYNVREFDGLTSEDYILETRVKNTFNEGSGVCQLTQIDVLYNGGAFSVPLSIRGCVSELEFYDANGKKSNPSALGVDFNEWVDVKLAFTGRKGQLYINGKLAFPVGYKFGPKKIVGLRYRFQGAGSVNYVKLSKHNGEVVYFEDFEEKAL